MAKGIPLKMFTPETVIPSINPFTVFALGVEILLWAETIIGMTSAKMSTI
ncbi:MAG: hypothetical protein GWN61_21455 [candidate division Zixibacteria bacterium]|nr:hypothetical protein [candidate division KSB1 bacterium]NIR67007.1 hypothetical protein [candidate division Zixibacteria bacterium]NIW48938.1 hypothetical protein [Gammaproteobacteria bacterium]NIS48429.1 hypothetical protein [candidate division Zixibacteria bacterium]NIT74323.1 hypothetical protein [candidate division KSB1 bacterium]